MTTHQVIAILLLITAVASYINYRYIKLPIATGLTFITLLLSLLFMFLDKFGLKTHAFTQLLVNSIDFNSTIIGGMIGFLLFAGGLQINALDLAKHKGVIAALATIGVVISTFITGFAIWSIANLFNSQLDLIHSLIFGALIAPTDPIAVIGTLRKVKAPHALEMKIIGESLFNDGIAIVIFVTLVEIASGNHEISRLKISLMFLQQLGGGIIFGFFLGAATNWFLKKINNFEVSLLITLAVVTCGYTFALAIDISGPIVIAMTGLMVGSQMSHEEISEVIMKRLRDFWGLIDIVLNAILFVLIGLIVFSLHFTLSATLVALIAIPITLLARWISVAMPVLFFSIFRQYTSNAIRIMTWGGLRGGISIALALSVPNSPAKDEIMVATYAVVLFSLLVQALTIGPLIRYSFKK